MIVLNLIIPFNRFFVFSQENCEYLKEQDLNLCESSYVVLDTCDYGDYDASIRLFEHKKSGAHIVHLKNKDMDKGFGVGYKTFPENDNGVNHILEHCICAGSPKYNDTNLFFNIKGKTSNTYFNAATGQNFTVYVVSCFIEKQLLNFADMVMSCTLDPIFLHDKRVFYREACRLELDSRDEPIRMNGTVLNEMTDNYAKGRRCGYLSMINSIFKDHNYYDAGGNPDFIPNVTFEELAETWQKFYHPSNSIIFLYGDLNVSEFLDFLDVNFLSHYDKLEIQFDQNEVQIYEGHIDKDIYYPSSKGNKGENGCDIFTIYHSKFADQKYTLRDYSFLVSAFNHIDSPFRRIMREEMPDVLGNVTLEYIKDNILIIFEACNISFDYKEKFNNIVSRSIKEVLTKGFCDTVISSFRDDSPSKRCWRILDKETKKTGIGINFIYSAVGLWSSTNNWDWIKDLELDTTFDTDKLPGLMQLIAKNSENYATVRGIPKAEIIEEKREKKNKKLENIKRNMNDDQLDELINFTRNMSNWLKQEGNSDSYKYINNVTLPDIDFKFDIKPINEKYIGDIRAISSDHHNLDEVSCNIISFGMQGLSKDERRLVDFAAACAFWEKIGTDLHNFSEINNLVSHYFYKCGVRIGKDQKKGQNSRSMEIYWSGLSEDYNKMFDIIKEILTSTNFSDIDSITRYVSNVKKIIWVGMSNNAVDVMINRGIRSLKGKHTNSSFGNFLETYKFVCRLENDLKNDPNGTIEKMKNSLFKLLCSEDVSICTISNKECCQKTEELECQFIHSVRDKYKENKTKLIKNNDKSYEENFARREAFVIEEGGQYNGVIATSPKLSKYEAEFKVLSNVILNEYLLKKVRDDLGAYDCKIIFSDHYMVIISGSDPNLSKTFRAFGGMCDWLDDFKISQEKLDEYKIKACTDMLQSFEGGLMDQIYNKFHGMSPNNIIKFINKIKDLKVQNIRKIVPIIKKMMDSAYWFSIGSSDKINKESNYFGNIIYSPSEQ